MRRASNRLFPRRTFRETTTKGAYQERKEAMSAAKASSDDLFLVVGRDDFVEADEGSVVLCRSCADAGFLGSFKAADTLVFKAKGFLSAEQRECEGYKCCQAHHGQACVDAKANGFDCQHEGMYEERREKTRERLRLAVINHRIATLEGVAVLLISAVGGIAVIMAYRAYKTEGEATFGSFFSWGFWPLAVLALTLLPRYLMFGTIRKKIRLPR